MAIVNAIPELWSAGLLRAFDKMAIWASLCTDLSGEFASGGDRLHLNEVTGTITVSDYEAGKALRDPETPDDSDLVLIMDQKKYFNIAIEDIERFQARPAVFEEWTRQASAKIANLFDRFLYGVYNDGWTDSGAPRNRFQYTKTPAEPNAAWRQGLVSEGLKIVRLMDEADWPTDRRWCVISSEVKAHLLDYLIIDKSELGQGAMVDQALQAAALSNLFGCTVRMDNQLPTAAAAHNPYMLFGMNDAIAYGRQISKIEAYRPEKAFQDAVKGLFVYGAIRQYSARKYAVTQAA